MEPEKPSAPYYALPAGLMVPLVKLEDSGYKPLDPEQIRLPPPTPPNERLMAAVELFYSAPSHERPRDPDGWERLGLYEWSRDKQAAVKKKQDDIDAGIYKDLQPQKPTLAEKVLRNQNKEFQTGKKLRDMMRERSTRAHLGRDRGHEQEVDQQVEDQLHQGETEEDLERDVIKVEAGQEEDKIKIDEKELSPDLGLVIEDAGVEVEAEV